MKIDKKSGIPKYVQLKNILVGEITKNFKEGDRFFTERQIMDKYQVSCATVAHAMKDMVVDGYFVRKRGGGTFIESKTSVKTFDELPEIILNGRGQCNEKLSDPLGWFIRGEMQRGIINNYNGPVKILNFYDLMDEIKKGSGKPAILIDPDPEILKIENEINGPYILIDHNHCLKGREVNTIYWEQLPGVYEGMKYLIEALGHRRIGFIGGVSKYHIDRFAGYQIGLRAFDISYDEDLIVKVDVGTENDGYGGMRRLLSLKDRPTAVFVDTDIKAVGAINAVRDAGLGAPEDISILGYDDIPGADEQTPPLTTVRVPNYEMGCRAAEMMKQLIETGESVPSETLFTRLVIRNSCAKNEE